MKRTECKKKYTKGHYFVPDMLETFTFSRNKLFTICECYSRAPFGFPTWITSSMYFRIVLNKYSRKGGVWAARECIIGNRTCGIGGVPGTVRIEDMAVLCFLEYQPVLVATWSGHRGHSPKGKLIHTSRTHFIVESMRWPFRSKSYFASVYSNFQGFLLFGLL